jgi:inner membrane protein
MQKTLLVKAALVAALFAILLVPLQMIGGLVAERQARQQEVVKEIAASSYGRQAFAGPFVNFPYLEEYEETVTDEKNYTSETRVEKHRIDHVAVFFPESAGVGATGTVETKSRGLFRARVFNWQAEAHGEFVFDGRFAFARDHEGSRLTVGKPFVSVALGDPRGLAGATVFRWNGKPVSLERGTGLAAIEGGVHADLPDFDPAKPARFEYALDFTLRGSESMAVVPLAGSTTVSFASDWPHPSFGGQFLPLPATKVGPRGFEASWSVSGLATAARSQIVGAINSASACPAASCAESLQVRFIEPIDIYSLSDRALKYAFLFIGLTFGAFAALEIVKHLPIHPAQYLLVGLALAVFFLLLIALSEHIAFWAAYAVAAAACAALIGFYLSAVLKSRVRGASFAVLVGALYSALYGLLISEDSALLLGSLLVFALLAAAMAATRRLDWYSLEASLSRG